VAVSARSDPPANRPELLQALQAAADQAWILEPHIPPPPARLF
jgi:hypothetical protein